MTSWVNRELYGSLFVSPGSNPHTVQVTAGTPQPFGWRHDESEARRNNGYTDNPQQDGQGAAVPWRR